MLEFIVTVDAEPVQGLVAEGVEKLVILTEHFSPIKKKPNVIPVRSELLMEVPLTVPFRLVGNGSEVAL